MADKGKRFKLSRLFAAMVLLSVSIFAADNFRRDLFSHNTNNIVIAGDFKNQKTVVSEQVEDSKKLSSELETEDNFIGVANLGFSEISIPKSQISSGTLVIVDEDSEKVDFDESSAVYLIDYKNEYYTLVNESVRLNSEAAEALNNMMKDYNAATGLIDFIVYGTTETYTGEGSYCPKYFPESSTGYTIDFAIKGRKKVLTYDGYDEEAWLLENCYKYGFILRCPEGKSDKTGSEYCPWHLRYVGNIHATIMREKEMCLEEYTSFLKKYSFNSPFSIGVSDSNYNIYYVKASDEETTSIRIPISGNYTISGNNKDGYFVTVKKN